MNLRNPFPINVKVAFMDYYECYLCGENGNGKGGLNLHHIKGRTSNSALNASVLCASCHVHMGHSIEEEIKLMEITLKFLVRSNYQFTKNDLLFYNENKKTYDQIA